MNKKLLMQICQGNYEGVEKKIEDEIKKLNKIKLLSKVVSFANAFSSHLSGNVSGDLSKYYGKKI